MPCEIHNWWFGTACPRCAEITAAVTKTASDPAPSSVDAPSGVETPEIAPDTALEDPAHDPDVPMYGYDNLEIPDCLRRNSDNTLVHPEPWGELKPLREPPAVRAEDIRGLSDAELNARLYSQMSVAQRQPYLQEATRRENRRKAHERLDKAGFLKSKGGDPSE